MAIRRNIPRLKMMLGLFFLGMWALILLVVGVAVYFLTGERDHHGR
jgi:hypothetical protein